MEHVKLIRNNIPRVAEQNGDRKGMTRKQFNLSEPEQLAELISLFKKKILEEAKEVLSSRNEIELKYEIVDVLQLLDELCNVLDITDEELEILKQAKEHTHGTFIDGYGLMNDKIVFVNVLDLNLNKKGNKNDTKN